MKVAILGYGLEGESAFNYYRKRGVAPADFTVFDEADEPKRPLPAGVRFVGGTDSFDRLAGFGVVVRTPQISPARIITDGTVTSVTKLFFEHCTRPIIGITGTKGKGTTASLTHALLSAAGVKSWLVGNIGTPALDVLDEVNAAADGVVIYELSSFQLWDMTVSPSVAIVLMIEPDHLEVHGDMDDYVAAKANIARWQTAGDTVIFHPHNPLSRSIAELSKGIRIPYGQAPAAHVKDQAIYINEQKICSISEVLLPGKHNVENICAALTAASRFVNNPSVFADTLRNFKGLEHRLELVATVNGILYYDDSFSSMPGATEVAIAAFTEPKLLIVGGYDRGLDFSKLATAIAADGSVKTALLIGQTRHRLAEALAAAGFSSYEILDDATMPAIVSRAAALARPGDVVLLSPGCASFDMFKNFYDRGQQFKQCVQEML
ncbi:UDP-N-acetylmuramoyl-L-alanine--D-glutamate ligase [Candidatus Saccharibacteria bacterium]|nr:UDP-N-acetylmuramoyl-L-alanine--D-glutamate ligase [Candidatus Saccharibacteria bacterium]